MRKSEFLLALALLALVVFFSGCSMEPKGFVQDVRPGLTSYETTARMYRTCNFNGQMAWEDWDHFWMIEAPSTLDYLRIRP
jgi:hypothetical protein